MSASIDQAFIKQYEAEVQEAYQRHGSKLRPTVRSKSDVRGASTIFQKVGKGTAAAKARNGVVPVMNIDHTTVECFLQDYYAGDWIDRLDELKTNIDERAVVANAGAYALGRKTDELIIAALDSATPEAIGTNSGETDNDGLTRAKVLLAFQALGNADVPDDGNRFAVVGWKQWSELLTIQEFANADYIGPDELPWKGTQAKRWLGATWMPHSGLTKAGTLRYCYFYHKSAVGHAVASEIATDVTWHGDRAAHFVNTMMSQGAVLVDNTGVVRMRAKE
ncbi:phage capsid protein [Siccirubricoccus sp. KC 17139]|uniref:Phage capsid protein n=1 Tax=Siccirubricoccus soli TaxID=2899147 RepID=A0ABT1DAY8_9PROT|nr:phage capsid protein [Siccirubricoccus soli]MCO6419108.1 phage capsid protein [Siccirubricoccus soli]MCP2685243.1 phage capsid protein [Siccirubricoccus soli]